MTLRDYRKNHDMTQEELAALLEVDGSSVSKYESNDRAPSIKVLRRITKLTKGLVTIDSFTAEPEVCAN